MEHRILIGWLALFALGFVPYVLDHLLGGDSITYYLLIWAGWTFYVYPDYFTAINKWMTSGKDD